MRPRHIWLALVALAFLGVGASLGALAADPVAPAASPGGPSASPGEPGQTSGTGTFVPGTSTPPASGEVDVCALVPLGDVQALSPFTTPLVTAESQVSLTVCLYSNWHVEEAPLPDPVSITMVVTSWDSSADAMTVFSISVQDSTDRGVPPQAIADVGDVAAAFPGGDEVAVRAVLGNRTIDVRLKGQWPDVSDPQKVPAGTELVKLLIARLP
jgi:hypothetical protein